MKKMPKIIYKATFSSVSFLFEVNNSLLSIVLVLSLCVSQIFRADFCQATRSITVK